MIIAVTILACFAVCTIALDDHSHIFSPFFHFAGFSQFEQDTYENVTCPHTSGYVTCDAEDNIQFLMANFQPPLNGSILFGLLSGMKIQSVDLSNNQVQELSLSQPNTPFTNSLQHLNLANNALAGSFPVQLNQLSALKVLDLSGNRFVGALPQLQFENMTVCVLMRSMQPSNQFCRPCGMLEPATCLENVPFCSTCETTVLTTAAPPATTPPPQTTATTVPTTAATTTLQPTLPTTTTTTTAAAAAITTTFSAAAATTTTKVVTENNNRGALLTGRDAMPLILGIAIGVCLVAVFLLVAVFCFFKKTDETDLEVDSYGGTDSGSELYSVEHNAHMTPLSDDSNEDAIYDATPANPSVGVYDRAPALRESAYGEGPPPIDNGYAVAVLEPPHPETEEELFLARAYGH